MYMYIHIYIYITTVDMFTRARVSHVTQARVMLQHSTNIATFSVHHKEKNRWTRNKNCVPRPPIFLLRNFRRHPYGV